LTANDLQDRGLAEAVDARGDEREVEVRADPPRRPGVAEGVTAAAAGDEELLAADPVTGAVRVADGVAAGRDGEGTK
jgi:hypothetical protein